MLCLGLDRYLSFSSAADYWLARYPSELGVAEKERLLGLLG
jgi:hypothetical protein